MKVNIHGYNKSDFRKIKVQIQHFDTWNLDSTLALIIYPALVQFKASKSGIPGYFTKEAHPSQLSFDFYKEDDCCYEAGVIEWNKTLDKMIWSFQQACFENYTDAKFHQVSESTGQLDYDYIGHQMYVDRINEGFELFGKWYAAMWT